MAQGCKLKTDPGMNTDCHGLPFLEHELISRLWEGSSSPRAWWGMWKGSSDQTVPSGQGLAIQFLLGRSGVMCPSSPDSMSSLSLLTWTPQNFRLGVIHSTGAGWNLHALGPVTLPNFPIYEMDKAMPISWAFSKDYQDPVEMALSHRSSVPNSLPPQVLKGGTECSPRTHPGSTSFLFTWALTQRSQPGNAD